MTPDHDAEASQKELREKGELVLKSYRLILSLHLDSIVEFETFLKTGWKNWAAWLKDYEPDPALLMKVGRLEEAVGTLQSLVADLNKTEAFHDALLRQPNGRRSWMFWNQHWLWVRGNAQMLRELVAKGAKPNPGKTHGEVLSVLKIQAGLLHMGEGMLREALFPLFNAETPFPQSLGWLANWETEMRKWPKDVVLSQTIQEDLQLARQRAALVLPIGVISKSD